MVMALMQWCNECDNNTMHHNGNCVECSEKRRRVERAKWLALTQAEQIEILLKRIEKLEQSPLRC